MYSTILIKLKKKCMYVLLINNKHTETTDNTINTLFTIHNYLIFAASYISDATREARAVATAAEARKKEKYALLSKPHHFVPIAIEASGALGPDAAGVSRAWHMITSPSHSFSKESIALQHGNAASVLGTTSSV